MEKAENRNNKTSEPKTRHSSPATNHSIQSYRDLIVWQKSMDLVEMVYQVTKEFPKEELYGLSNQLRRAVVSVPSNIAEGQARSSTAEFRNFLSIARGSLAEIETQLLIAERLNYIESGKLGELMNIQAEINKMTNALMSKLAPRHSPMTTTKGGE
jgi:four helix bundle protein